VQDRVADSVGSSTPWRLLNRAAIKSHRWHSWPCRADRHSCYPTMYDIIEWYLNALSPYEGGEVLLSVDERTSVQTLGPQTSL